MRSSMSHVLSGTSTHRQAHSQQCPFRNPTKAHCTPGPPRVSRQKGRCQAVKEAVQSRDLKSDAELFAEEVGAQDVPSPEAALPDPDRVQQLRQECAAAAKQACLACSCQNSDSLCAPRTVANGVCRSCETFCLQVEELQQKLDALYKSAFSGVQADHVEGGQSEQLASSAAFGKLGREQAKVWTLGTRHCVPHICSLPWAAAWGAGASHGVFCLSLWPVEDTP